MKTLKILSEDEFNKISKDKAVWYEEITQNGATFSCVVIYTKEPEYYIEIKRKAETYYVQQDRLVYLEFSELVEEHMKTY